MINTKPHIGIQGKWQYKSHTDVSLYFWIPQVGNIKKYYHFWLISVLKFTGVVNWVVPLKNADAASLAACSVGYSSSQYQYCERLAHGSPEPGAQEPWQHAPPVFTNPVHPSTNHTNIFN